MNQEDKEKFNKNMDGCAIALLICLGLILSPIILNPVALGMIIAIGVMIKVVKES